ncbi:MAG: MarR family transcriptional regulator [Caulobacteraceae bacterium]|nr:MarR family transcriptional regulator [Caulobacteraceae bacterium]
MSESSNAIDVARATAVAGELRVLAGQLKRRLREEASLGDFTWSQTQVLLRLERDGPATVTGLAREEGVRPQSMGATVAVLEAAGLVSGSPHPTDGRQTLFALTDHCRERVAAGRGARQDWLFRGIQAHLAPGELDTLAAGVALLRRLIET